MAAVVPPAAGSQQLHPSSTTSSRVPVLAVTTAETGKSALQRPLESPRSLATRLIREAKDLPQEELKRVVVALQMSFQENVIEEDEEPATPIESLWSYLSPRKTVKKRAVPASEVMGDEHKIALKLFKDSIKECEKKSDWSEADS